MGNKRYVVIGGVACGPKAASRLRRLEPEAEITIIEKGNILSYGGCGMPYYISGEVEELQELWSTPVGVHRDGHFFQAVKNIKVIDRAIAETIDRENKTVHVVDLQTDKNYEIPYDKLILAVGGVPKIPPIEGIDLNHVFKLNHPFDAEAIKKNVDSGKIKKATIIGGGLIGLEVTEALVKQGVEVTVVEMMERLLPKMLDSEMSALLKQHMRQKGVNVLTGTRVVELVGDDHGELTKVITDRYEVEADMVLFSIGVVPNTQLAADAGLEIDSIGAIQVNEYLQTSDENIYAGGDCIDNLNLVTGKRSYSPLGDLANIHGRIIANNIAGKKEEFRGILGTAICKVFEFNIGSIGLTEEVARSMGHLVEVVLSPAPDKAHFFPGAKPIYVKLIGDTQSGKILGAQVIGSGDVSKRINMVAMGLYNNITVDEMGQLDLAYAPPFSPALDNLITAAHILQNKMNGLAFGISPLAVRDMVERGDDFILLDVRSPKELEEIRLPYENVINIPLGLLRKRIEEIPKGKEIITFCKISLRGYEAQRILQEYGFEQVKFMDGGLAMWPFEKEMGPVR